MSAPFSPCLEDFLALYSKASDLNEDIADFEFPEKGSASTDEVKAMRMRKFDDLLKLM